ncbi:IclR family transcriptional regulator [Actinopolymorpha singaporensis]|uniref:Glycerol operon regulatory protein n=1 Tax=Actinopolymorpha singaporensis TaxID=117157 RepID=A0A1H1R794_9ACTN|nr:IclR family transcriptional regulator [Actinopolymorpha singaporensis]SDS30749.1 transcriptional regulator, IclR family [Actinopolymorpha singaporensis]
MTEPSGRRTGGVQSVERSLELLELLADAGGDVTLSQLAASSGLPAPTIHRLLRTLAAGGYVRQEESRRYALGPRLIRLGEAANRMLGTWARPHLRSLMKALGETANLALLDGDEAVYVAQVQSEHAMRIFTEVGRHVSLHATGVGKALLALKTDEEVRAILDRTGMPARTPRTITRRRRFFEELATIRKRGYAIDDGEQEVGVRCVALTVPGTPTPTALSVSGPEARITDDVVAGAVPLLRQAASDLSAELSYQERES